MLILGIDTATKVAGAAIVNEEKLISERFISNQRTHSINLLPMIQQVVADAETGPDGIEGIAVASGPGSFTGLRIGMAAAKTMAQVLKIPLVGVNTLEALSFNLAETRGMVCPILDARKNEVYTAIYDYGQGQALEVVSPKAVNIEELITLIKEQSKSIVILGDAVPVYHRQLVESLGQQISFASKINGLPRAAAVAQLGLEKIRAGERAGLNLEPTYIRPSEAEVTWQKKQKSGA